MKNFETMAEQYKTLPCVGQLNDGLLRELKNLCRFTDFPGIRLLTERHRNECLSLIWPKNLWLRLAQPVDVAGYSEQQLAELNDHYQGFKENLCLIGAIQIGRKDVPIFVGKSSRIFCHDLEDDVLYYIAEDFDKFVRFGILGTNVITCSEPVYTRFYYDGPKFEKLETLKDLGLLQEPLNLNSSLRFNRKTALALKALRRNYISMLSELDELARCKTLAEIEHFVSINTGLKLRLETPIFTALILQDRKNIPQTKKDLKNKRHCLKK